MNKEFSIKVNGVTLKSDTLYQVVPKIDHNAPDGFKEHGTSKLLSPIISETVSCIFDSNANVWDTGFYVNSPCYRGMKREEVEIIVDTLQKTIVTPVEQMLGEGKLSHYSTNTYWDELMINLRNGKVFNTSNPVDLLYLYMAILHNNLAPKEEEEAYRFKKAKYCIVNKQEVVSIRQKREMDKNNAIGLFYTLFHNDKQKLLLVFDYIGLTSVTEDTPETTFNSVFNQFITDKQNGYQNVEIFLQAIDLSSDEAGIREMSIFRDLKTLFNVGVIIRKYSEYFLDEVSLGTNFKDATQKVLQDKNLEIRISEVLEARRK